jgi:magnesium-transporting ATPase (P-type)
MREIEMNHEEEPLFLNLNLPSLRSITVWFLAIIGIIIIIATFYVFFINLREGFSELPYKTQVLIILQLLVSFSVGLTEIVVAWLLSSTEKEDNA